MGGGRDEKVNECIQGTCHQNPILVHQFLHSEGVGGTEEEGEGVEEEEDGRWGREGVVTPLLSLVWDLHWRGGRERGDRWQERTDLKG